MMSETRALYRDRLTGRRAATPPLSGMLVGRWVLENDVTGVFMNSAAAAPGDFVVPERSGQWHVLTSEGYRQSGMIARAQTPDDLEAESVRAIGDKLDELSNGRAAWREWAAVVPLAPGMSETVDLLPVERLLQELYGHLETVCRKPRAHLHVEIERAPVSKARRIPPSAASYLAAHTEDWDRKLLRGILPKRVLAEVRQDLIDIYENRVTARLIDNISEHLSTRIHVIRRLLKVFQEKEDYSASIVGTYQRGRRMSALWGESIDASEGRKKAQDALRHLEALKYRLLGLLGSPLYEGVPRRTQVATTLKSTNVFANDQHYRRVAQLWREWACVGDRRTKSTVELHAEAQRLSRGFDAFAMLLTVRALESLGYEPSGKAPAKPIALGESLLVRGHGSELTVTWRSDGTIGVADDERELVIVGLTANLAAGGEERLSETLGRLREAVDERDEPDLLVLFLASEDDTRTSIEEGLLASLHTVGNDPRHALAGTGCLPVSPWEIGSTERVARALRWFLWSARFLDYPPKVIVPESARGLIDLREHTRWLTSPDGGTTVEMLAPPLDNEWRALDVQAIPQAAEASLQTAQEHYRLLAHEPRHAGTRRKPGALDRRKHDASNEVKRCERMVTASHEVARQLQDAYEKAINFLNCPSCGERANPTHNFERRNNNCFRCNCIDCSANWEVRLCADGHRYASMIPAREFLRVEKQDLGWVDRIYGSDILALPAQRPDGRWGFVCPECGQF
jgi:hypothetical protein